MQDISEFTICAVDSSDTFEIPTIDSGDTLLDGSLPSLSSSDWSSEYPNPPSLSTLGILKASTKLDSAPLRDVQRDSKSTRKSHNSKTGARHSDIASRREALVLDRRLTLEKISRVHDSAEAHEESVIIKGMIGEIDMFFSNGMKRMDSAIRHLGEEKDKLKAPSLIVSTSTAVLPVSFDSSADLLSSTPPLATRRGKKTPLLLKLDTTNCADSFDYPDVPSAFQCSPNLESACFAEPPRYPSSTLNSKMTAEQMIVSLQRQVQQFRPASPSSQVFRTQCSNAERWLEDELLSIPASSNAREIVSQIINRPGPPAYEANTSPARISVQSHRASIIEVQQKTPTAPTTPLRNQVKLPSEVLKDLNSKPLRRKSSDGSAGKTKQVRFSLDPPSTIPFNNLDAKQPRRGTISSSTPSSSVLTTSPTKRKPAPRLSFIASPTSKMLPPTPLRCISHNAPKIPSPLNPARQTTLLSPSHAATPSSSILPGGPTPVKGRARGVTVVGTSTFRSSPCASVSPLKPTHQQTQPRTVLPAVPSIKPTPVVAGRARSLTVASSPVVKAYTGPARRRASEATMHTPTRSKPLIDVQNRDSLQPESVTDASLGIKENRKLKIGLSFAKCRASFNEGNKENAARTDVDLQCRKREKAGKTISLPFQGVLNLLRG